MNHSGKGKSVHRVIMVRCAKTVNLFILEGFTGQGDYGTTKARYRHRMMLTRRSRFYYVSVAELLTRSPGFAWQAREAEDEPPAFLPIAPPHVDG